MSRIVLVTGGSRSGKSAHAQKVAESLPGPRTFVATCPLVDDEIRDRVRKHRRARDGKDWRTIEETLDVPAAILRTKRQKVVLVDCITLWVNNLMYEAERSGKTISESQMVRRCRQLLDACREHPGTIIFVTNEVGMSIVPDNALSRRYRDLVGRANQIIAAASDAVYLVVCGQVLAIKEKRD
jgi:adenosylcobinamide kinase / adenosylcobinamide-phosphate guanylyltransferase